MPTAKDFLDRLPKTANHEHRTAIETAFHVAANFSTARARIEADKNLSFDGKREAMAALIKKDHAPQFRRLTEMSTRMKVGVETARANFKPAPLDHKGEARRDQIRTWLRSLPAHERFAHAFGDDPAIREAVIDAPNYLSGLSEQQHGQVIGQFMTKTFGAELRALDDLEEAVAGVDAAVQVAFGTMMHESNLDPREFVALVQPQKVAA